MYRKVAKSLALVALFSAQTSHELDRFPPGALLADGRVTESAPRLLVIEQRNAGLDGTQTINAKRISFDLTQAEGYVYFLQEGTEMSLREGLNRLRPGAWLELAPMPKHEFSKWQVAGSHGAETQSAPGSIDALKRSRPQVQHYGVSGWLYIWVITEPGR
jgi:hypothetical protein